MERSVGFTIAQSKHSEERASGNVPLMTATEARRAKNSLSHQRRVVGRKVQWIAASVFCLVGAAVFTGCGPDKYPVVGSPIAIGAEGVVEVEKIEGDNLLVNVTVEHLPPPQRFQPPASLYMMWFIAEDGKPVKAGNLEYDPDDRVAKGMATTHLTSFKVWITAEETSAVASPNQNLLVVERKI